MVCESRLSPKFWVIFCMVTAMLSAGCANMRVTVDIMDPQYTRDIQDEIINEELFRKARREDTTPVDMAVEQICNIYYETKYRYFEIAYDAQPKEGSVQQILNKSTQSLMKKSKAMQSNLPTSNGKVVCLRDIMGESFSPQSLYFTFLDINCTTKKCEGNPALQKQTNLYNLGRYNNAMRAIKSAASEKLEKLGSLVDRPVTNNATTPDTSSGALTGGGSNKPSKVEFINKKPRTLSNQRVTKSENKTNKMQSNNGDSTNTIASPKTESPSPGSNMVTEGESDDSPKSKTSVSTEQISTQPVRSTPAIIDTEIENKLDDQIAIGQQALSTLSTVKNGYLGANGRTLVLSDVAFAVANAPDTKWVKRYNISKGVGIGGSLDTVIKLNSTADFSVKGLVFDARSTAMMARKLTVSTLQLLAAGSGMPIKASSSVGTDNSGQATTTPGATLDNNNGVVSAKTTIATDKQMDIYFKAALKQIAAVTFNTADIVNDGTKGGPDRKDARAANLASFKANKTFIEALVNKE